MDKTGVSLRPIGEHDLDFLQRVYASTRAEELALVDWNDAQKASFLRMQFEAQHTHYKEHFPKARFDIIEVKGDPVGRLYVDRRPDEIRIIDIALLPEWRNRGAGSALLRSLLDEAGGEGKAVRIHVEQNNPAMQLYLRLGFTELEDQGVYRLMEWRPSEETEC